MLAVVAAVVGLAAVVGVGLALTSPGDIEVDGNVLVNPEGIIDVSNSPTVAYNPAREGNVVVSFRKDRPGYSALLAYSYDGGESWQQTVLPLPPDITGCTASQNEPCPFAPDLAFAPDGTLARVTVDPKGPVHATWLQANEVGLLRYAGRPPEIVTARSDDGGRTFASPVRVNDPQRERVVAPSPVIDDDGHLVVMYQDLKANRRDFENQPGPAAELPFALVLTRSTDGGRTFAPGTELESEILATRRFLPFLPELPQLAASDGKLYATWADGRNDPQQKKLLDAYLATSTDGGKTFDNVRLSVRSFDKSIGPSFGEAYGTDFGTKLGLAHGDGRLFASWVDTGAGTEATGRQDVNFAAVDLPSSGGGRALVLGAALVLVLGGAFLVLALALSRRKPGGPPTRTDAQNRQVVTS